MSSGRSLPQINLGVQGGIQGDSQWQVGKPIDENSACVEVGKPIDENPACVEMREYRKTKKRVTSEQKIELAKLQLAKLEKEIELQLVKNKALSLNPAAKVEEKQFETNIENMIKKGAHAYAYSCGVSFPNVSVSNVIENSSYDLPYVKNFNTRNDLSSLIKDYKCNKIKSTKLKMNIKLKNDIPVCQRARRLSCSEKLQVNNQIDDWLRQGIIKESVFDYCSDIVLCKKANGAMKTSSVEFISRSPTLSPMNSKYRRFSSGLHGNTAADSVRSEWPLWHAAKSNAVFARRRIELKQELKLLDIRAEAEKRGKQRERERESEGILKSHSLSSLLNFLRAFGDGPMAGVSGGQGIESWLACLEFEPSATKDPPCRAAMHVKSIES
ncbi:retrovirus-related Pol polyprotein from transposon 17.6 [Trichonephila clavipes]|nr:retrovirus-related Pol polyprotein from transposon 17.6 [Trichonephila clavipes]